MTKILLDTPLRNKLLNLAHSLELCDENGQVLAVVTPFRQKGPNISEEELDRRELETESCTTAELLAHLERQ